MNASSRRALNDRLRMLEELHEGTSGLRGTTQIAPQALKDARNMFVPGLDLSNGRIGKISDPVDGQDVVSLSYFNRQM